MKILLIKMSSLGDVIHTLPALSDAQKIIPSIQFDWVVEPAFSEIPAWHPVVNKIIPVNLRYFKKHPIEALKKKFIFDLYQQINQTNYDLIIDAQGLLKSAVIAKLAKGVRCGYDKNSIKEKWASYFYDQKYTVSKELHAISRIRELFSKILNHDFEKNKLDYGINFNQTKQLEIHLPKKYIVFLHATTWPTKHYSEKNWEILLKRLNNIPILLPWGNFTEKLRAENFTKKFSNAILLPKLTIAEMAFVLKNACVVVAVDTGLGHLSAALLTPTISLYGPTDPKKVGTVGENQVHLVAATQTDQVNIDPEHILEKIKNFI